MNKKEIQALRRPFVKELFRNNKFNLVMTVLAAFLAAVSELVISWTIKGISDLISGDTTDRLGAGPDLPLRLPRQGDAAIPQIRL